MSKDKGDVMMSENRLQHLGKIYHLVEQFELISRTDLAKLSGFAPASITNLTKSLIDQQFILERTVQNHTTRGRPAVGLAISPFYWQLLSIIVSPNKVEISLCELNGTAIYSQNYTVSAEDYPALDEKILSFLQNFEQKRPLVDARLLAVSVSVIGRINAKKTDIVQLGNSALQCAIVNALKGQFTQPILLNEHFQLWLLTESKLGRLISHQNVLFLQHGDTLRLGVMVNGSLLHKNVDMNINHLLTPSFGPMSDEVAAYIQKTHPQAQRYQIADQLTFPALAYLIDCYLPNTLTQVEEKITFLCQQIEQANPAALAILEHVTSHLAHLLMNLLSIFSSEKIMLNSPLLPVKDMLFEQLTQKLAGYGIRLSPLNLVTSLLEWDSPFIACSAIKQGIYEGNLIKDRISL